MAQCLAGSWFLITVTGCPLAVTWTAPSTVVYDGHSQSFVKKKEQIKLDTINQGKPVAMKQWARTHWTDKICLPLPKILTKFVRQIFDLSSLGALRYSRIFVNHKCQSHRNKHHRFARCSWERLHEISRVMMGSLYVTVIFTASIECVASAYYLACEYSRLSYAPCVSHVWESAVFAGYIIIACVLVFSFLEFVQLQQKQLLLLLCRWRLRLYRLQLFGTRNNNFSGLRTEILRLKIEMKFSWLTLSFKSCRFQAWEKFVLLRPRQDDGVFEVW